MSTEVSLEILPSDLAQIVESVFAAMLSLEACVCESPWNPGEDRLTAAIHLAGDWNGVVLVECERWQACRFAGRFLSMDPPDKVDDDVRDVLGELANMIGGNLKSVLSRGIHLSMPAVVEGSDYSLRVCGAEVKERISFDCAEGLFWITILTTKASSR